MRHGYKMWLSFVLGCFVWVLGRIVRWVWRDHGSICVVGIKG